MTCEALLRSQRRVACLISNRLAAGVTAGKIAGTVPSSMGASWEAAFAGEDRPFQPVYRGADSNEGPRAPRERREPR